MEEAATLFLEAIQQDASEYLNKFEGMPVSKIKTDKVKDIQINLTKEDVEALISTYLSDVIIKAKMNEGDNSTPHLDFAVKSNPIVNSFPLFNFLVHLNKQSISLIRSPEILYLQVCVFGSLKYTHDFYFHGTFEQIQNLTIKDLRMKMKAHNQGTFLFYRLYQMEILGEDCKILDKYSYENTNTYVPLQLVKFSLILAILKVKMCS